MVGNKDNDRDQRVFGVGPDTEIFQRQDAVINMREWQVVETGVSFCFAHGATGSRIGIAASITHYIETDVAAQQWWKGKVDGKSCINQGETLVFAQWAVRQLIRKVGDGRWQEAGVAAGQPIKPG